MFKQTKFPYLIAEKPERAKSEIKRALRLTKTTEDAAKRLGVSRGQLNRYMKTLGIKLDSIQRRAS